MAETGTDPSQAEEIGERLARIEEALDSGESDLRALGFWRLLARIKRDPALVDAFADLAGRIDRKAFEAAVRPRFPVWFGNAALAAGIVAGAAAIAVATSASNEILAGAALLAAGGILSVAVHSPAHWLAGRAAGIGFTHYFFGGPPPPRPGLKTDYATYLRASPAARAWMHASGAIATKLAPFIALAFYPATSAPAWAAWALAALGVIQILTDVAFSTKTSDWKKVRRELRVARARRALGVH